MNACEIANGLVVDPDLLTAGNRLVEFSDLAMQEKYRKKPLDCLYRGIMSYFNHFIWPSICAPDKVGYYDFASGHAASGVYLALNLSSIKTSPAKTLRKIKELGVMLNETYCEPVGRAVSEEDVRSILDYLDAEYDFKKAVFSSGTDMILLLPYSHRECNSECLALQNPSTGEVRVNLFLYHMSETGVKEGVDPRYVFCHELGQALLVKYNQSATAKLPEELLVILEVFYPSVRNLNEETQVAIVADVLAMGMLYESPFADADPFSRIHAESKKVFRDVLRLMCEKTVKGQRIMLRQRS